MIWTISSMLLLNHLKNLEEPVRKKCSRASSELLKRCGMNRHWTWETDSLNRYTCNKNLSLNLLLYISHKYQMLLRKYE